MKSVLLCIAVAAVIIMASWFVLQTGISRRSIENAHGLKIPHSARSFQQLRDGGLVDHGILSVFEIDQNELDQFVAQLKIRSRNKPALSMGDPCRNGWNVWPTNSFTFVPGSQELERLKVTWSGGAKPIEMLSCESHKGDWLHVEIWSVADHALVKLYTNWD